MPLRAIIYPRPKEEFIYQEREKVNEKCPVCGSDDVKKYPVITYLGPKITVKCQNCLHTLRWIEPRLEDRWPPYWSVTKAGNWPPSVAG